MTPGGCDLGAQTPQTTVLTGVPSSPRTASCAPPAPSAGKSCEGFPPGGCFYCLEKEALGFNTSRSSRLPSARADARGTGASAASSAAVPAPPPGPAPHPWVGAHARARLPAAAPGPSRWVCSASALPAWSVFSPGKSGFGARRCLLTRRSDAVGSCPALRPFRRIKSCVFLFLQLTEVKTRESRIPDLQEPPGSIRWRCQGVGQHLGRSISSGMAVPIPLSPFVPVTDRWDISPCQGCCSSGAAATWKLCRTCFSRMCCQGVPNLCPHQQHVLAVLGKAVGDWSSVMGWLGLVLGTEMGIGDSQKLWQEQGRAMTLSGVVFPGETLKSQEIAPCEGGSVTLCSPELGDSLMSLRAPRSPRGTSGGDLEAWNRSGSLCPHACLAALQLLRASSISCGVTMPALAGEGPP